MAYKVIVSKKTTEYWSNKELLNYVNKDTKLENDKAVTEIIPISHDEYETARKTGLEEKDSITLVFADEEEEEHTITIRKTNSNFNLLLNLFIQYGNIFDFIRQLDETCYEDGTRIDFENDAFDCIEY